MDKLILTKGNIKNLWHLLNDFAKGFSVEQLANKYILSIPLIKKIIRLFKAA